MVEHGASGDDEGTDGDSPTAPDSGADVVTVTITPDADTAEYDLLEIIANQEGTEIEDLPSLYTQVDHFVETLFEDPPSPESQMEITFSYAGYRVTIMQNGNVRVVPVKETLDE